MKKLALALSSVSYLAMAASSFAAGEAINACPPGDSPFAKACGFDFTNVLGPLITTIFIVAVVIALLYLIWGGIKWLTSGGDKGAVQAAREHIIAAIVGLVIIFLAYFIVTLVLKFFFGIGVGDNNALILPSIQVGGK